MSQPRKKRPISETDSPEEQPKKVRRTDVAQDVHSLQRATVTTEIFPLPELPAKPMHLWKMINGFINFFWQDETSFLINKNLIQVDSSIIQGCGKQMPLMGRTKQYDEVWHYVKLHLTNLHKEKPNKLANARLFVIGSPGIGKTRFALQLPNELKKRAEQSGDPEILQFFVNTLFVHISFDAGSAIQTTELQLLKGKSSSFVANYLLVSRALKSLFGIGIDTWDVNKLPSWFKLSNIANYLDSVYSTSTNKLTICWHLDELQSLILNVGSDVAVEAIKILSLIYEKTPSILLFTGTMVGPIKDELARDWTANFPNIWLHLQPLDTTETAAVIDVMATQPDWNLIPANWKNIVSFIRLIANTGGVPRMLELVLQALKDLNTAVDKVNMMDVQIKALNTFRARYSALLSDPSSFRAAISWTLTGNLYEADRTIQVGNKQVSLASLVASGMMQTIQRGDALFTSVPFLCMVVMEQTLIPAPFMQFWNLLRDPAYTLSGQDFEMLSCLYQTMRLDAFLACGITSVQLTQLFNGAMCYNLIDFEVKITKKTFVQLVHRWPGTTTWPTAQQRTSFPKEEMLTYLFRNTNGAAADAIDLYQCTTSAGKFVMLAHKNEFACDGQTELTATMVVKEWKKLLAAIENETDPTFREFMDQVHIVLFFFTNQMVQNNIDEQVRELWVDEDTRPSYIITHDLNSYLGPFASVVHSFK